ncbi:heterodisulfide reductase-related iron-sulfur binding cluster [Fluviispira vulneris]|uniref:heterodisulfide reductase-related iron-sulfur binding cluster n=1 Tax=Fluviispira vulneris TaxID=2763012 RepID=UPI0016446D16|nr:(Fe-S)-binding protein [Fluviispira vulneris]
MDAQQLTRQIYWSPSGGLNEILHMTTYVWLLIAMVIFVYGVWKHIKLWRMGKAEVAFDRPLDRFLLLFRNVIAQAKVLRARRQRDPKPKSVYAAWMHGLIFYGFLTLLFATTIVALKDYHILDVYYGWFYAFIKVSCQVAGIGLAIGLLMGIFRRSDKNLGFKHSTGYTLLYSFLFLLVIQGFLLQGFRLAFQENAPDMQWAFLGNAISFIFPKEMSADNANVLYTSLWYFHMVTTMAFVAFIPYTRAMHIVTASLNLYTQRLTPTVMLAKMDFENAEAEYFGARDIKDFTWKDLLSFDSCTECRRCTDICPANAVGKPLDPREVILKLKNSMTVEALFSKEDDEKYFLFENGTITHNEIWSCTNCGGCVNECPVGIDQLRTIMQLRRYQTLSLGEVPTSAGKAIENIKQYSNPWGLPQADRFKWAEGLDLPIITGETPEVEYLYYVGCAGSYDLGNQKVARAVVNILKYCGVDFAVMGKAEKCNGEPVKRLGDEYSFSEIANSNVEQLNKLKFKKIVTHCPHCFNTLKNDYQEYGGKYEVYHHSQLLTELYKSQKLKLPVEVNKSVTFHDPCFLGRHNGEYDAPRQILEAVAGLRLSEMESSRETSNCCGMGGGNMWYESEGGGKIVENRLKHVAATGAQTLVTGCSFCMINFKSAFQNLEETKNLEVMDIAEAIALAMPSEAKNAASMPVN